MSDWKINHTELQKQLDLADKYNETILRRTICNKLLPQLKEKTPFSESELRKLIRLALINYEMTNEIPFQRINMLDEEERRECLFHIKDQFKHIFDEILKGSSSKGKREISDIIEGFFS
jgi:uncharacterized protein YigA (DUF484 family)